MDPCSEPTWQFPHSLVICESCSTNHVDGGTHGLSVKSYGYRVATDTQLVGGREESNSHRGQGKQPQLKAK